MTHEPRLATPSAFAPGVPRNADLPLTPQPSPGRGAVTFDLPGVHVGTAEYGEGPTGCTVIHLPRGARTAVDARGGAVGMSGGYDYNHAICLAGGSVYGLAAAAGVSDELLSRRSNLTKWDELQLVSGAVIYDFSCRDNAVYPDAELGRAAVRWAREGEFPVGRCGAGRTASAGKVDFGRAEFAGQGPRSARSARSRCWSRPWSTPWARWSTGRAGWCAATTTASWASAATRAPTTPS
ncbi:P1 family peptidase [Nonomuraea thailandensis]